MRNRSFHAPAGADSATSTPPWARASAPSESIAVRLSQKALGAALGVTFQQVQKYELGVNSVACARLPALCPALAITPNDLYGLTGNGATVPFASAWAWRLASAIEQLPRSLRSSIALLVGTLTDDAEFMIEPADKKEP